MESTVFHQYLSRFKTARDSEHTHTSIVPGGKYYVPATEEERFFRRYSQALLNGDCLTITEKHKTIGPFLIDLDFRFHVGVDTNPLPRVYTHEFIEAFMKNYMEVVREFLVISEDVPIYILEKPKPTLPKPDSLIYKDGLHIIIPSLISRPAVQWMVRERVLPSVKPLFENLGCVNTAEDIIDEAVIYQNNWQMYGSRKPNCDAYQITKLMNYHPDGTLETAEFNHPETRWNPAIADATEAQKDKLVTTQVKEVAALVTQMSIRNKFPETPIHESMRHEVTEYQAARDAEATRRRAAKSAIMRTRNLQRSETLNEQELALVYELVRILNPSRAERYDEWIRLGWCLHTIDYRLLTLWDEFSKNNSNKWQEGVCAQKWDYMRPDGLSMGTLHMWAKKDNPQQYAEIIRKDMSVLMNGALSMEDYDIAKVAARMFAHRFRCSSVKHKTWYEYRGHRWHICDVGFALRRALSEEIAKEFNQKSVEALNIAQAAMGGDDSAEVERQQKRGELFLKLSKKMRNSGFKEKMLKECGDLLYDSEFENRLDSNTSLMCFNNGVYDFQLQEFREGRPDDYVSYCTGIDYIPYNPDNEMNEEVLECLRKILPKPDVLEYVLTILASALDGNIREEKFHIWTGSGSNGKSICTAFFEKCIGEYACKFNVSMLTQKRIGSNETNSELVRAKGKRFAVLQEPGEDERINVGIMKELTGGDVIIARALFKESVQFKPQFKLLLCCNRLPSIDAEDGGTWRRVRCVEFTSKFCVNPVKENEFMIDMDLHHKLDLWKETFMSILIEYYKKYVSEGVHEPEDVLKCTLEYQRSNDFMADFFDLHMVPVDNEFVTSAALYTEFRRWSREEVMSSRPKKKDFDKSIRMRYPDNIEVRGAMLRVKGYQLRSYVEQDVLDSLIIQDPEASSESST